MPQLTEQQYRLMLLFLVEERPLIEAIEVSPLFDENSTAAIDTIRTYASATTVNAVGFDPTKIEQPGDDLKAISTRFYETPDMFLLIAKENGIGNPDTIEEGKNLLIPKVGNKQIMPSMIETVSTQSITDTAYTVGDGDLLWNIAVRAYGDGNKWKDIMSINNLQTPDAIFTGMILQLPR